MQISEQAAPTQQIGQYVPPPQEMEEEAASLRMVEESNLHKYLQQHRYRGYWAISSRRGPSSAYMLLKIGEEVGTSASVAEKVLNDRGLEREE